MGIARKKQSLKDWITQQWVIIFGEKIDSENHEWLLGPFGDTNGIGQKFISQLAMKENLIIDSGNSKKGIIKSIEQLNLDQEGLSSLSRDVVDFYENTSNYELRLKAKWNPIFKIFGFLVRIMFSKRINQLNIPTNVSKDSSGLTNEVIHLIDSKKDRIKWTIWLRAFKETDQIVYSGVYDTCKIPSGKTCIKAIFPLPNGNATVILTAKVGKSGELLLDSSGQQIGDSGFYFLLEDSKGQLWTKFIKSFKDKLVVRSVENKITATQTLTLWNYNVLKFEYEIERKKQRLSK